MFEFRHVKHRCFGTDSFCMKTGCIDGTSHFKKSKGVMSPNKYLVVNFTKSQKG